MEKFHFNDFFSLEKFAHRELFSEKEPVWKALENIKPYLKQHAHSNFTPSSFPGAYFINPHEIVIGDGTIIEPGAYIKGPCIIGKGCEIRHGAYIRGNVIVGDGAVIGHTTEVKNSIILNNARAGHFAYLGDSIIGDNVNLGAGVKCANLRLDEQAVIIKKGKEIYNTELRKLGSIIGDGSSIGCNSVLNPGTILGRSVYIWPCMVISGYIGPNSIAKPSSSPQIITV